MPINHEPLFDVLSQYDIKVVSIRNESYKDKKVFGGYKPLMNTKF